MCDVITILHARYFCCDGWPLLSCQSPDHHPGTEEAIGRQVHGSNKAKPTCL